MNNMISLLRFMWLSAFTLAICSPVNSNAADYGVQTRNNPPVCTARDKQPPIWRIIVFVASGPKCWLEGEPKLAMAPAPPPPPPRPAWDFVAPLLPLAPMSPSPPPLPATGSPETPPPELTVRAEQQYAIYFLQDTFSLTPEARDRVLEAVDFARTNDATSITITGHSDALGSAEAQAELSEGRARAVAAIFLSRGFSQATLKVRWKGGSEPAVAIGGEVHEPLNDRAAIIVTY